MATLSLNLKSFYNFARLQAGEQSLILKNMATLLDSDSDEDQLVNLYFINGFFVEESISIADNKVVEILPFKQGYRISSYTKFANEFSLN